MSDKERLGSTYIIIKKNSDKSIKYATDSNRFAQNYRSQVQRVQYINCINLGDFYHSNWRSVFLKLAFMCRAHLIDSIY